MKKFSIIVLVIIIILALVYYFYSSGSFSAEINGVPVEASNSVANYSNGKLSIFILLKGSGNKTIAIYVYTSKPGIYSINSYVNGENGAGYSYDGPQGRTVFVTNSLNKGKIEITELDLSDKKVSGTFEFTAAQILENGFGEQVVRITKGAFEDIPIK